MFSFSAYFWNSDVYIGRNKYLSNEILISYLTMDTTELRIALDELTRYKAALLIDFEGSYNYRKKYNNNVYSAMDTFQRIDSWLAKLPPYNKILRFPRKPFNDLLNEHSIVFEDGIDYDNDEMITEDTVNEYGFGYKDDCGNYNIYINNFQLIEFEHLDGKDFIQDVIDANGEIENYFNSYILFICSCIEVKKIFLPFVRDYLNSKDTFLNTYEIAEQFAKFEKDHGKRFDKLECSFDSFNYTVFKDSNGKNILCEKIVFPDISSFFFYDLFSGIEKNYIPNYCRNCGKFFHISGGKYLLYCNSPVKGKSGKTCKELGSQRRYNDKCKNDPVWQTYNRAYKAHYARYMKKKMTTAEFEQWSRFASELRDKAEKEEITFEEYYEQIRE